jgi:hypothetical protein
MSSPREADNFAAAGSIVSADVSHSPRMGSRLLSMKVLNFISAPLVIVLSW